MQKETIGYSKIKTGALLLASLYLALMPLVMKLLLPGIYDTTDNTLTETLFIFGMFAFISITGLALFSIILFKLKTSKHGIMLDEHGIYSNVSGLSFKLIPWSEVVSAGIQYHGNGQKGVLIATNKSEAIRESRSTLARLLGPIRETIIWPHLLDKKADEVVDVLNRYLEQYKENEKSNGVDDHSLKNYVQKAA